MKKIIPLSLFFLFFALRGWSQEGNLAGLRLLERGGPRDDKVRVTLELSTQQSGQFCRCFLQSNRTMSLLFLCRAFGFLGVQAFDDLAGDLETFLRVQKRRES